MKRIILPLADGEKIRAPILENVKYYKIYTKDIKNNYASSWYCEVGKFIQWTKDFDFKFKHQGSNSVNGPIGLNLTYGIIQNRRFFQNLNELNVYSNNEVILAKKEWLGGLSIINQFKYCHPKYFEKFLKICKKLEINENLLEDGNLSPHNIFISKLNFLFEYSAFLQEFLDPFFDPNENDKVGAFIAERLLHIFANTYFKVRTEPIITLPKINR